MGQGAVELGRDSDLPGDVHKPVDMKVPNSAEAKVSLVGGIAHANESMGQALFMYCISLVGLFGFYAT